jgi:hypothetical protein
MPTVGCETDAECADAWCSPGQADRDGTGSGHVLAVKRFVVKAVGRRPRFLAEVSFAVAGTLDPGSTGVGLEVWARDGRLLYEADVPGGALRASRSRRAFRYVTRRGEGPPARANGLRRLSVRFAGGTADVLAAATSSDVAALAAAPGFGLVLRLGGACLHHPDLSCSAEPAIVVKCR